jgi:hypothetical protein
MGRKKRNNAGSNDDEEAAKRLKPETGEVYLVKKYRAEKNYASMEAFVRYTKAHRMLDASYVRWNIGVTAEKPFVFSTRVGGTDLGWGRGKTREAAMDCAVRAAFALVNAHGYKNFTLDEDCLTQLPEDAPPPPPPPPPPPFPPPPHGMLLAPGGLPLPPLPPGYVAPPPVVPDMIPQPKLPQHVPVPSTVMTDVPSAATVTPAPVSLTWNKPHTTTTSLRQLKGGLVLVFDPQSEGPKEVCMEELRLAHPRYQSMMKKAAGLTT